VSPTGLRHRLSAHDSVFLYWERPEQPMHVGECMVYRGSITAADMVRMIEERLHLLPRYRQKVVFTPLSLAHPTWEDDPDFDVRNHVDEMTLPAPGDDVVLSEVGGRLFSELLDRSRPLWKLTVLSGHASGDTIVLLKLHHAMVDGVSSIELIEVLHSPVGGQRPPSSGPAPRSSPGTVDLVRDAVADSLGAGLDRARGAVDLLRPGGPKRLLERLGPLARAAVDTGPMTVVPPPRTPFNRPISPARQFAWVELPIDEVGAVRRRLDATVNDLVLAILSGGLGRYMRRHGYPTDGVTLRAMCPVSVRRSEQSGAMGNLVSMVVVPLHVGVTGARERLDAERAAMRELKGRRQANGLYEIIASAEWFPAALYRLMWRMWPQRYFPLNITTTNVAGPRTPLHLGEHELLHWYPVGVNWTTSGLFLCTLSYREHLTLGLTADPTVVPDLWEATEDLRASYEELRSAAGVRRGSEKRTA
jgi:diacylglycerol O-acyltransferase / wax synthase